MVNLNELKIGDLITRDAIKTIVRVGLNMEILIKTYDLKYRVDLTAQSDNVINTGEADESEVFEVVQTYGQDTVNKLQGLNTKIANYGAETITDTAEHTGTFRGIYVLEDAIISAITLGAYESGNALTGFILPAGVGYNLDFTAITLTSGKIRAIKGD
jgi:hypothetical protein